MRSPLEMDAIPMKMASATPAPARKDAIGSVSTGFSSLYTDITYRALQFTELLHCLRDAETFLRSVPAGFWRFGFVVTPWPGWTFGLASPR
jgi:hypothetical protein